jgi:hypothetical protein
MAAIKPAIRVQTLLKLFVAAALITILMKSATWWLTDSVGLLSDATEYFVNLASALFAILMVTIAARPADDDQPSGHDKAEYFSSGFEGLLIVWGRPSASAGLRWTDSCTRAACKPWAGVCLYRCSALPLTVYWPGTC